MSDPRTSVANLLADAIQRGREQSAAGRHQPSLPTVGPHGANEVHLSDRLRALLRARATRQNRRVYNPEIRALQAQRGQLRNQYEQSVASADAYAQQAAHAVESVPLQGLRGQYRQQVASELANRSADISAAGPVLAQDAQTQYQSDKQALGQQILSARIDKKQAIENDLISMVNSARTDAQATVGDRADAARAIGEGVSSAADTVIKDTADHLQNQRERRHEVQLAIHEVERLMAAYPDQIPQNDQQWAAFEGQVAKAEGVGLAAARQAVDHFQARLGG